MEKLNEYKVLKLISILNTAILPDSLIQIGKEHYSSKQQYSVASVFADYEYIGEIASIDISKGIKEGLIIKTE